MGLQKVKVGKKITWNMKVVIEPRQGQCLLQTGPVLQLWNPGTRRLIFCKLKNKLEHIHNLHTFIYVKYVEVLSPVHIMVCKSESAL